MFFERVRLHTGQARSFQHGVGRKTCYTAQMFNLFNVFGRSVELNELDESLRASGLHPLLVPEAVKLTLLRLHKKEERSGAKTRDAAFTELAQLLAYCMLGRDTFIDSNSTHAADRVERRLETAIDAGDSPDAKLILLALHSGVMASEVADRFDVETH